MEWIGDAGAPAPQLKDVRLDTERSRVAFEALISDVELWLACNVVHGDLSAYNLLWEGARVVAIDFPQASDPRFNTSAERLLFRDIANVCRHFARGGVESDPSAIAEDLWDRFVRGAL
jgi:RIO kinase 1